MSNHFGDEMNSDLLVGLQQRLSDAGRTCGSYVYKIRDAADCARTEVASDLERAIQSLIPIVMKVHATYTEDEQIGDSCREILTNMKDSFQRVESVAESRHQEIADLHKEITGFQSNTIFPLQNDLRNAADEATRKRDGSQGTADSARRDYDAAVQRRNEAQADVDKWQDIVDRLVVRDGINASQWAPINWPGINNKAVVERFNAEKALDDSRNRFNEQQAAIEAYHRKMREALEEVYNPVARELASLVPFLTRLSAAVQDLASSSNKFKELSIRIKGSATNLVKEATELLARTEVTSHKSFTRSDLAQGILNICQKALFDILVQDDVKTVLKGLANVWTVNGQLSMPPGLKERYDEVQNIVRNFKQDGGKAEWDALLQELDASQR